MVGNLEVVQEVPLDGNSFGVEVEASAVVVAESILADFPGVEWVDKPEVEVGMEVLALPIQHWQLLPVVLTILHQVQ